MCRHCFISESLAWLRVTLVMVVALVAIIPAGGLGDLRQTYSAVRAVSSADDTLLDTDFHFYVSASSPVDDDDRPAQLSVGFSTCALLTPLPYNRTADLNALALLGADATLQSQAVRWQI